MKEKENVQLQEKQNRSFLKQEQKLKLSGDPAASRALGTNMNLKLARGGSYLQPHVLTSASGFP